MLFFGELRLQAFSPSGQLTISSEKRRLQLTGTQGSGIGFGPFIVLKKLNALFGC